MAKLDHPSYSYAGQQYAFYHLGSLLESGVCEFDDDKASFPVLLVRVGELRLALQLEESIGNREIVIKPIASKVMKMQGITGATILADGRVALIIDTPWIAELVKANPEHVGSLDQLMRPDTNKEPTVMVVDDSITIRKVTTRFLERNNYKAVTAKDGVDALQKLQKMIPDLILLDIEMPRMDGYEMASQVRKDERLKDVPIIMITSRTGEKHRNLALDVGVKHYLGKPYNEADLLKYIRDLQIGQE
jgi:chemosensory pili system protein ChpA (sensor histidine kinase/response regulator)